ncbi:MAG TPA: hypothetical protein VH540_18010 [Ktedonobacterales bacterium]|jgi:hypothetical protein
MEADPTQRRLINRLSWFELMQGVILGIMLAYIVGLIWARNVVEPRTLTSFVFVMVPVNFLLVGISQLITAKISVLRWQLHLKSSSDGASNVLFGLMMICFGVGMAVLEYVGLHL